MHQLGLSGDPAKNFTLSVPAAPDGTMKLARGNAGATTQDIMTVDADGKVAFPQGTKKPIAQFAISYPPGSSASVAVNNRQVWPNPYNVGAGTIDPDGIVDTVNLRITPKKAGYYRFYIVAAGGENAQNFMEAAIFKNGAFVSGGLNVSGNSDVTYLQAATSSLIYMNGTTEYVQPALRVNTVAGTGFYALGDASCVLGCEFVSS
jgi:hypothetical protein